jgi:hypothetical protein
MGAGPAEGLPDVTRSRSQAREGWRPKGIVPFRKPAISVGIDFADVLNVSER